MRRSFCCVVAAGLFLVPACREVITGPGGGQDIPSLFNAADNGVAVDVGGTVPQPDAGKLPATVQGMPCESDADCEDGLCVVSRDGRACGEPCTAGTCPDGWECGAIEGEGGTWTRVCLDAAATLCQPCDSHLDCNPNSPTTHHRCIERADGSGSFCGSNCGPHGSQCPWGYTCQETLTSTGENSRQCVPLGGAECSCNELGKAQVMSTKCSLLNALGHCTGQRACSPVGLTECTGQAAAEEVCNGLDDDCDGDVDEGVEAPCGGCDAACLMSASPGGGGLPAATDEGGKGVLELEHEEIEYHFIWIANSAENTVSKLDTLTGLELGRYNVCADPSRTSVDKNGDCWVGCRGDGKVAKIRNFLETCSDLDGDGTVETATDLNGDGVIQPNEMVAGDECVAFVVNPGGSLVRAVGVDAENHAWVGFWNSQQLVRLHPDDGSVVQSIGLPAQPYGLAIDQTGIIWISGRGGSMLVRVDPATSAVTPLTPPGGIEPYGIGVDINGDVWLANCCTADVAWRYRPGTGEWQSVGVSNRPRGVAASKDGYVYVANDNNSRVAKIDVATMQTLGYIELGAGRFPVGVAVDSQGFVWAVNQTAATATKSDPETMQVVGEYPVGAGPYTYSDMTGYALFNFVSIQGEYRATFEGWPSGDTLWEFISVEADVPGDTGFVEVSYRIGPSAGDLEFLPWDGPFGPYPPATFPLLVNKTGNAMEVRVTAHSGDPQDVPTLNKVLVKALVVE